MTLNLNQIELKEKIRNLEEIELREQEDVKEDTFKLLLIYYLLDDEP